MRNTKTPHLVVVPYPSIPLEDIYVQHKSYRGLVSKHTRDLRWISVLFGIVIVGVFVWIVRLMWAEVVPSATPLPIRPEVLAAMLSSFLAVYAGIFHLGKLRFSTVDVFSSEILARLRILSADHSVARIIHESDPMQVTAAAKRKDAGRSTEGVFEPSKESQFETFFRRSNDLGVLSSVVVDHVTDFYSFHMAARDALRELSETIALESGNTSEIQARTIDVLFMIDLMGYSGLRALEELVETPAHKWHCRQVALSVGTRANKYLVETISHDDHRYSEVIRRTKRYATLTMELQSAIKPTLFNRGLISRGQEFF